jgi:tetratricopeptide (TPR) repeat protein
MAQYADFLMRKAFYEAALSIFTTIATNEFDPDLASIWQKIGFCHQKLGHATEALYAYNVANSIKPNSKWTLSHLATLSYQAGQMDKAATYYQALLEMSPDNLKYLQQAAQSLMQSNCFDEALPLLYKASFLDEDSPRVQLLLAWCLLVNQKKDEAMHHIQSVLTEETTREEANILRGLALLMDGKIREAYQQLRPIVSEDHVAEVRQKLHTLEQRQLVPHNIAILFMDALTLHID